MHSVAALFLVEDLYHTIVIAHPALATCQAELKQERLEVAKELTMPS